METIELVDYTIWYALAIVIAAIILDVLLAVVNTFKASEDDFDLRKLAQFVATSIFPYVGGLAMLALVSNVIGEPYSGIFYPVAVAVLLKYLTEIKDKLSILFGISVK